jgi:hypothetical protein
MSRAMRDAVAAGLAVGASRASRPAGGSNVRGSQTAMAGRIRQVRAGATAIGHQPGDARR